MYIKQEDFGYFEGLYKTLDEQKKKKFLEEILKSGSKRSGEEAKKINVVDDSIYDIRGIEPHEMITRTIIRKAFKAAKEG